jgi:hypothetical protein
MESHAMTGESLQAAEWTGPRNPFVAAPASTPEMGAHRAEEGDRIHPL